MQEATPSEIAVRDPLSTVTRNERRFLLGVAALGIALVKARVVPTKISALGVEFSQTDQKSLLSTLAFITIYFLVAFAIYAAADFIAWRLAFAVAIGHLQKEAQLRSERPDGKGPFYEEYRRRRLMHLFSLPVSFIRIVFEFVLPIAIGVYAVILLFRSSVP